MLIASVLMLTSCGGLFTTSTMKGAARDPGEAAKALSKKPTKTLVADAGQAADQAQAQAVVGALSKKAKDDPTVITSLSDEDKKTVIDAALTAVIDLTSMATDVDLDALMSEDSDADEDEMMENIMGSIINNLGDCDTTCVKVILDDSVTTDANGDPVLAAGVSEEMKSSLALGAITVAAASVKGAGADISTIMNALDGEDENGDAADTDDIVANILGANASQDDINGLKSALNTLAALESAGYDFSNAFGVSE